MTRGDCVGCECHCHSDAEDIPAGHIAGCAWADPAFLGAPAREVVGYVIRDGAIRGEGAHFVTFDVDTSEAIVRLWQRREDAAPIARLLGGRVVRIVRKAVP